VSPALSANGQFFAFVHDVQLDVFATARVFPGILALFQSHQPSFFSMINVSVKGAFKPR
jgi:hypothetical protein